MLATSVPKIIDLTFMLVTPVVDHIVMIIFFSEKELNFMIKNNKKTPPIGDVKSYTLLDG